MRQHRPARPRPRRRTASSRVFGKLLVLFQISLAEVPKPCLQVRDVRVNAVNLAKNV
jgi:hypothetical protein